MASITPQDFELLVEQHGGDEAAARAQVALHGYTVDGDEGSDLAVAPGDAAAALQQGLSSGRQSIADMYKAITENIEKRYRAPSFNDMLIAIGTGMMSSPGENDSTGFGGAVQRGLRGIGTYAQNRNERRDALNDLMTKVDIQKVQDLAGLESKYLPLLKPRATSSTSSPVIANPGEPLRTRATGSVITEPPQPAIYKLQAYLSDPSNTPQDKVSARRAFDSRFGYGAANIFGGQQ